MPKEIPNKRYMPEFKQLVVETMLEEDAEGLVLERRGYSSTGQPKKFSKDVEKDLLAEVQRLRAENDYPKNLQALVLEDKRRQHKKCRQFRN